MKTALFTISGTAYWHFHPVGTGFIFTYHRTSMQILTTCELSGQLIDVEDLYQEGGIDDPEEFKRIARGIYTNMVDSGTTIVLDYMDDPTIVGCIGVDFDVLKN